MPLNSVLKNIAFKGIVFFMAIALVQCGQRGTPTGGPKDITAPQVKKSKPSNFSTNFSGTKIVLGFDEYVQVKSFKKEFVISPPVGKTPKYKLSGKKLILEFDTAFNENTTYTLFFGEAIVDLNEGNPLDSNLFVFSTGEVLDSLTLSGKIKDAYTGKAESDILVQLYRNLSDSAPMTTLPTYFAVAKNGKFSFNNLAEGNYQIFALRDGNRNYRYDLPDEKIAFQLKTVIVTTEDTLGIELATFQSLPAEQKIFKPTSFHAGQILLSFNKSATGSYEYSFIDSLISRKEIVEHWNSTKDSLTLFSSLFAPGNKYLMRIAIDTLVNDSAKVKIDKSEAKFKVSTNYKNEFANNFNDPLVLSFNRPLQSYCDTCLVLMIDSTQQLLKSRLDSSKNQVVVDYDFKENQDYQVFIRKNAFTSILGEYTDSIKYDFPTQKAKELGNLVLTYDFPKENNYRLELLKEEKVISAKTMTNAQEKIDFKGLLPGNYQLRLIFDENKDGQWTPGSLSLKKQSEKVEIYPQAISIRANWDIEVEWILTNYE